MCPKCGNPRDYRFCLDVYHDSDPNAVADRMVEERRRRRGNPFLESLLDVYEMTKRNPFS